MNRRRIAAALLALALGAGALTGCAFPGETEPTIIAEMTEAPGYRRDGSFQSRDGRVSYRWAITDANLDGAIPVLTAQPHYLRSQEVAAINTALFGDSPIYDRGPESQRRLSKPELEKAIAEAEAFLDPQLREECLPYIFDETLMNRVLNDLRSQLENAPDSPHYEIWDGSFRSGSWYADAGGLGGSGNAQQLQGLTEVEGRSYAISATVEAGVWNHYRAQVETPGGMLQFTQALVASPSQPTQAQIEAAREKAVQMLAAMGLGEFAITRAEASPSRHGTVPRYVVMVEAAQVLAGSPTLPGQQRLQSFENHYPAEYVRFQFDAAGKLLLFELSGLCDVAAVEEENPSFVPLDTLCAGAESYLSGLDFAGFEQIAGVGGGVVTENCRYEAELHTITYGLARENADLHYAPAAAFHATIRCLDENGQLMGQYQKPVAMIKLGDGKVV